MSSSEQSAQVLLGVALVVIVLSTLGLIGVNLIPLSAIPNGPSIQVEVIPLAIPVSGVWEVSTFLNYQNMTRFTLNSNVTMTATLADHTQTVSRLQTTNGQATFQVPSNTVGVRFDASSGSYEGSRAISGPTVYNEVIVLGFVSSGLLSGVAFVNGLPRWFNRISPARMMRRTLFVVLPIIALIIPVSYIVFEEPGWVGTGWAPASVFGIPVYFSAIPPIALTLLEYVWPDHWPVFFSRKKGNARKGGSKRR